METLTHAGQVSGAPMAADSFRWVILECYGQRKDSSVVDSKTAAICRTSTGWLIRISFLFAAPPASSLLCYDWPGGAPDKGDYFEHPHVVAAHGGSILIEMKGHWIGGSSSVPIDHFLYDTGTGGLPPSLLLLPACYFPMQFERRNRWDSARRMTTEDTGLLRRRCGDGDLLVAQLEVTFDAPRDTAEICVLRSGRSCWELRQAVPIVNNEGDTGDEPRPWRDTDAAVPVGDRFLCWVNYLWGGFLLCDMAEDATSPKILHVGLPVAVPEGIRDRDTHGSQRRRMEHSRKMGAAGADAVRFVSVDPRCCCGGPGKSTCARSRFAFTVTTWTMKLTMEEPMTWVKDGVLDCDELWALPAYEGLPRVYLDYPVVSLDNPDIVCFMVCENRFVGYADIEVWRVEVDMRSKALLSAVLCKKTDPGRGYTCLPVKLQW